MASVAAAPEPATPSAAPDPHTAAPPPPASDGGITLFVGASWLVMVVASLWLVIANGFVAPFMDEFPYITPVLTGEQPLSLGWLWTEYVPNRIPFAKLLNVALLGLTNYDFRAAPVCHVLWLGATAFALVWIARQIRGRLSPTDAVFPLILLGWSHWENLAWSMQLHYVLAHVVLLSLLLFVVARRAYRTPRVLWVAAGLVALLPVLGPGTLAYVPTLGVWLAYLVMLFWRDAAVPRERQLARAVPSAWQAKVLTFVKLHWRQALVAAGPVVVVLAVVGLHFLTYEPEQSTKPRPDLSTWLRGMLQGISMALASDSISRLSVADGTMPLWTFVAWPLVVLYTATAALLIHAWLRRPTERPRAAGLLLFLGSMACLMVMFSLARADGDQILAQPRYSIFAMPPVFCAYYAWLLYGPRQVAALVHISLFAAVAVLLPLNLEDGYWNTKSVSNSLHDYVKELRAGVPAYVVADRYFTSMYVTGDDPLIDEGYKLFLTKQILELREAGVPPFRDIPPARETVRFVLRRPRPVESENVVWLGKQMHGEDLNAFVTYALPEPEFVLAVLIRYRLERGAEPPAPGTVMWKNGVDREFVEARSAPVALARAGVRPEDIPAGSWVWVNDTIDHLRLHPSNGPFALRVDEITLLVPKETPPARAVRD